jgi:hypothetical protein
MDAHREGGLCVTTLRLLAYEGQAFSSAVLAKWPVVAMSGA